MNNKTRSRETGRPANYCTISPQARAILDGLLIGDGSYPKTHSDLSSYLSLSVTAIHEDWILALNDALKAHGLETKMRTAPAKQRWIRSGKRTGSILNEQPSIKLASRSYRDLIGERRRWYSSDGIKHVPRDLDVNNPIMLAHWHMGDGNAHVQRNRLVIRLHTNGFTDRDVSWLRLQFSKRLGIKCTIGHWRGQPILTMYHREANKFVSLIKPFVVPSFAYKIPDDPWQPGRCKVCDEPILDRRSSAKYCSRHPRGIRAHQYPNRPVLQCIRCNVPIANKIYRGKYCPAHREEVRREHVDRMHAKRSEARRVARLQRQQALSVEPGTGARSSSPRSVGPRERHAQQLRDG